MIEILALAFIILGALWLLLLIGLGILVLISSAAGYDTYDTYEPEEKKLSPLLGVVSPKDHINSKGSSDV